MRDWEALDVVHGVVDAFADQAPAPVAVQQVDDEMSDRARSIVAGVLG